MNKKHTPGPWLLADSNFVYALHDYKGRQVNRFGAWIDHYPAQGGNAEEGIANARLIAAAPDLLEALRDMVSDRAELSEATVQFAKAAIAKATGGEAP